ncbi:PREDICTED: testis- and ovary-specific PAZ domain-containing protein 1 [Eurypyga helias]|uniref:testis- and ovary-specific PAZ domain-containing protein 1 n=1 Tax=Eurypyga helias TaxID=54383 RepID=UPI000528061F|nr:PREDICTED: testis- and ovary-specific PAZ domain-containing protein 1 [Eurypyga helias]
MPHLRLGKVVTAAEVKSADEMVTSPSHPGAGVRREPKKKLVVKQSPRKAPKRKLDQPLSSCLQPDVLSSVPCEQHAPPVPVQEEQAKGRWKVIEQDSGTQAVKKLKANQNRSEDSQEKEPHYSGSPTVATLGEPQTKSFPCHPVTKKSGVQYKKRKPRTNQLKGLRSSSVTTAEKVTNGSAKCDAEHGRNALNHCDGLLCATVKNPFVSLEDCINTFVNSSASGTTSSCKISGFLHAAQDKRKDVLADDAVEQSDMNCSTSRTEEERSPIKGGLLFNEEEKTQTRGGCFSSCQGENSKPLRGEKGKIGRKHRRKMKITEKPAVQNIFTDTANECSKCELKTEAAVATSSSFTVLGLNPKEISLSASYDHTSNLHTGRNTHEAQNTSVWRKTNTELLAFEEGFKKTPELSVIAKEENSESVAHHSAASGSLRGVARVRDGSNCHKSKTDGKRNKVNKKSQQFSCQRTVPMTSKRVWPVESCARISVWVRKNHESISERKRLLGAVFEKSSDKSSAKAVLNTGNMTKFKIPLCRNKPEPRKLESLYSLERKTCSPLELLESTSVSRKQKMAEKTSLVNSKQQRFPVASDATSTASMKKKVDEIHSTGFQHIGSGNLSNEMFAVPECFSSYPQPFLDRQLESSVPNLHGTECVLKSNFPDYSWNSVEHPVALEINNDSRSRGNLPQHRSQHFPDILEAYKEDVLVIDVIQDDPELFGTSNKEDLALEGCENFPVKTSYTSICIKDTKQDHKPEYPVISEDTHSLDDNFRRITTQESGTSNDIENSCDWVLKDKCVRTHNFPGGSSPLGGVAEDFLEDRQLREPDDLLKSFDTDEKAPYSVELMLEMIELPRKYCRFYFLTLRGCERAKCWFAHVPEQGDEKICMSVLRTYINVKGSGLLKRAAQIFVKYYTEVTPGVDFSSPVLNDLLISLLKSSLLQEVFQILNVTVQIHTLPAVDVLLKVFQHVASLNLRGAVPTLISTLCKLVDAGMCLEFEHFHYIIKFLHQLQASSQDINTVLNIKSSLPQVYLLNFNICSGSTFAYVYPLPPLQYCKVKRDWTKLAALYINARAGCENFCDLQKLSLYIAEILTRDSETHMPGVPFCTFADAVLKKIQCKEGDRTFIGRTGISVMYSYHKVQQWIKGRKVLDKLYELQIHFTVLKGILGAERLASRCQIVNKAAEIFIKTGSLDGATWVLRVSKWTTNVPAWPCGDVDILDRHHLMYSLVHKYLGKSLHRQAYEVLQNLPGFQDYCDTVNVSEYSCLFNKLIRACFESKNLGVSSSAVDFMLSKNIAIEFSLLRGLITALGRRSLWSKARTYYKSALSLGCYPPLHESLYHKLLIIPSYLSEVEMLLVIEIFLVSNASDIQSPVATSQTLQIILKRCEDQTVDSNGDYQVAVERLIVAAHLSDPKLFLKHITMNVNLEEVYSLEFSSALKWLQENMKWAGKVWLFDQ